MCLKVRGGGGATASENWRFFSLDELRVSDVGMSYPGAGDGSLLFFGDVFEEKPVVVLIS